MGFHLCTGLADCIHPLGSMMLLLASLLSLELLGSWAPQRCSSPPTRLKRAEGTVYTVTFDGDRNNAPVHLRDSQMLTSRVVLEHWRCERCCPLLAGWLITSCRNSWNCSSSSCSVSPRAIPGGPCWNLRLVLDGTFPQNQQ